MIDNKLRITAGNTFATAHTITARDVQGQPIPDFDLQECTDIQVYARNGGSYKQVTSWQLDDQSVVVKWYGKQMKLGGYDFYIAGKFGGADWRTSEATIFEIVQYNEEANIPSDTIVVDGTYFIDASFSLITEIEGGATPSDDLPLMDGTADAGTSAKYSRGDHRHPSDTSKQDVIADLATIRAGAQAGATAYQKPASGIPKNDLASGVIPDVSNFITKSVNDLVNYYTKSQTYTQAEVQQLINAVKQFTYESVSALPTASSSTMNKIYLVPSSDPQTQNVKDEYITIESSGSYSWEQIGSTAISLDGYVTTQELNTALASYTTTTDLNTLLAGYQTKIDSNHKLDYSLLSNAPTIPDAQIQSDWEQTITTAKDYIKNKPTIPAAQVNSDWSASSGVAQILNKPTIPTITFRQW